jgi:hypothetical protein
MPRTLLVLTLFVALVSVRSVLAGPPDGVSGRMVLDEVADGLQKYRSARDENKRTWWLRKLGPTRDPRVAVVLGEAMHDRSKLVSGEAVGQVVSYFLGPQVWGVLGPREVAELWWKENAADLRQRARQFP